MMVIRDYRAGDRESCLGVFDSNVPAFFAAEEREGFVEFLGALERWSVRYFVIVDEGRTVGCGGVGRRGDEARMCWGMVDRQRQGEGLGRLLLVVRLVVGAAMGARHAGLATTPRVASFFEREGFRVIGGEDDHYGPGMHRRDLVAELDDATVLRLRARLGEITEGRVAMAPDLLGE